MAPSIFQELIKKYLRSAERLSKLIILTPENKQDLVINAKIKGLIESKLSTSNILLK